MQEKEEGRGREGARKKGRKGGREKEFFNAEIMEYTALTY